MNSPVRSTAGQVLIGALLGGLSGALCIECFSPHDLWPLAPFAFAPFAIACCIGTWKCVLSAGVAHGLVIAVGCLSFVLPALHKMAKLSWPAAVALWLLMAGTHCLKAIVAAGLSRAALKYRVPAQLVVPSAWILAEGLMPVVFPWPAAVLGQGYSPWLQLAAIGGPLLVSWWIVAAGAGIGVALIRWRKGRPGFARPLGFAGAVAGVACCLGMLAESGVESRIGAAPSVLVGIVQRGEAEIHDQDEFQIHRKASLDLVAKNPGVGLVVWSEGTSPAPLAEKEVEAYLRNYVRTDRREGDGSQVLDVPVLLGLGIYRVATRSVNAEGVSMEPSGLTNSMVLFGGSGKVVGRYNKQVLVPVGEAPVAVAIPMIGKLELVAPVTRYQPGKSDLPLQLDGHRISTMICYEDLLPSYVRGLVKQSGSELLVSASSDSWFEGEQGRRLHFMLASLRAVETRRYLVRATRDGISGLVTPTGRVAGKLPSHVAASGAFEARWLSETTTYVRLGDWPMLVLSALTILVGAFLSRACTGRRQRMVSESDHAEVRAGDAGGVFGYSLRRTRRPFHGSPT